MLALTQQSLFKIYLNSILYLYIKTFFKGLNYVKIYTSLGIYVFFDSEAHFNWISCGWAKKNRSFGHYNLNISDLFEGEITRNIKYAKFSLDKLDYSMKFDTYPFLDLSFLKIFNKVAQYVVKQNWNCYIDGSNPQKHRICIQRQFDTLKCVGGTQKWMR